MDTNILTDIEQQVHLEPASLGKRFLNLVIDMIAFYALVFIVGAVLGVMHLNPGNDAYADNGGILSTYLLVYSVFFGYYALLEGLTKGRTLGKLLTGTVAVKEDGSLITWMDACLRSVSRMVPFEAFSAFNRAPWHDRWTHTMVIRKNHQI